MHMYARLAARAQELEENAEYVESQGSQFCTGAHGGKPSAFGTHRTTQGSKERAHTLAAGGGGARARHEHAHPDGLIQSER